MGRAYFAIGVTTVLWAGNFTAAKIGTSQLDPWFITAVRILATALVYWLLLPPDQRRFTREEIRAVLPIGVLGIAVNHACFAAGIKITTPSHSAVIHALIPVFVGVAAWLLLHERFGPAGIFGMLLAVAGALVVVLGATRAEVRGLWVGDVLTTVGITAFSLYTVQGRKVLRTMDSVRAVTLSFVVAAPFMLPILAWSALGRQDWGAVTWKGWTALAYMFVCANLVCYRLHIYALRHLKAGQVAAFTTLQPAIGIGVAVAAGVDRLTTSVAIGAALALAGIVLVQLRPSPR
ncbi:MAG TPA: DMT family transporter [Planctomycetota bacterium]